MPTPTTTYSLSKPTVGGDDNAWGTEINNNLDKLDDLLDGTLSIAPNLVGWEIGGVAVTSTAAELNILDGVTASTAELNILDGVTASTSELNILDGVTSSTAELNVLDGITSTTAELNILDGVTSTAAELNVLDGIAGIASQVEAEAGTATDKLMTPERTKQAIDALVTTSLVLAATAAATAGAVGSYAFLYQNTLNTARAAGDTVAGSNLRFSSALGQSTGATPSGTWRIMGDITSGSSGSTNTSLWLRIS
jgi:hypothetical protein